MLVASLLYDHGQYETLKKHFELVGENQVIAGWTWMYHFTQTSAVMPHKSKPVYTASMPSL